MTGRQRAGKFESKLEKRRFFGNDKNSKTSKDILRTQDITKHGV